jgi:hypothetical protein
MIGACGLYNLGGSATASEMKICKGLGSEDLRVETILEAKA